MRVPASVAAGLVLLSGCAVAGLSAAIHWPSFSPIGYYVALVCGFHIAEFLWSWRFEGKGPTFDAFLLNQNWPEYQLAIVAALVEYAIEAAVFPSLKSLNPLSACGLALCLVGLSIRGAGMWTAGSNFAHRIAEQRRPDHVLVRHGIYSVFRHPSYVGWTYWSLGTQVLLCNPVCLVVYAFAAIRFFRNRIDYEEQKLLSFFGEQYLHYVQQTYLGIPLLGRNIGALKFLPAASPSTRLRRSSAQEEVAAKRQ